MVPNPWFLGLPVIVVVFFFLLFVCLSVCFVVLSFFLHHEALLEP